MHVLVVDDDPLMVELVSRALRAAGHLVEGVLSAEAALLSMRDTKPELVVLDARMPGMDGFALLKVLKAGPEWVDVPVLMLTSLRSRVDVLKATELGASGYVVKPFDAERLLRQVDACLSRRAPGARVGADGGAAAGSPSHTPDDTWLL